LLDEMFSGLKPFLKILGWDVVTVEDVGLKGAADEIVVEFAREHGMVIVTQEQGVAELARLRGVKFILVGLVEIARIIDERLKSL
ncbi:MAG: DUF5615 family PIN-like protein, partial [Candidatus Hadarchaeales archaeon]